MSAQKVKISMRISPRLLADIDAFCAEQDFDRTYFFETLARAALKRRNRLTKLKIVRTWQGVEDMPLHPKVVK